MTTRVAGGNTLRVIAIREATPCKTLEQVGSEVGLTRERVRQILRKNNLPTKHYIVKKHCVECGKVLQNVNTTGYCFRCWNKTHSVPLICDECGVLFWRRQSEVIAHSNDFHYKGHVFCTKRCYGKWFGMHYGFGVHPENAYQNER